jgi:predicted outer membrane repeat protein
MFSLKDPFMVTLSRFFAFAVACLGVFSQAHAVNICAVGIKPKIWVGDVATNPQCGADTIQAAIDAADCPNTQIIISAGHIYNEQKLTIINKSVALVGNAGECGVDPVASTQPVRTISGTNAQSVIAIGGNSDVTLQYVEITGTNESANTQSKGGGIFFGGTGSLTLEATTVDNNAAAYGGGIAMSPSGSATLTLLDNTYVINNSVTFDGGGIRIEGQTQMFMLAANSASTVSLNHAPSGYGGGIEILGDAIAYIGAAGAGLVSAVSFNTAKFGAGIAIVANGEVVSDPLLALFSTNPTTPVNISNNTASSQGGGIYMQGHGKSEGQAFLYAQDFRIDDNVAPDGSAIFATGDAVGDGSNDAYTEADTTVVFNSSLAFPTPTQPASLGAVPCAAKTPCNEMSGNSGFDSNTHPIGATVNMSGYQFLGLNRVSLRQNAGAQIISLSTGLVNSIQNCLIVDNQTSSQVILSQQRFDLLELYNCTFANNTIDNGPVISATSGLILSNDLFFEDFVTLDYQQGDTSLHDDCPGNNCLSVEYVVSEETHSLGPAANFTIQSTAPRFVDAVNSNISQRNYHLTAFVQDGLVTASPAIDFATTYVSPFGFPYGDGNDLDDNPRGQDVPLVPNQLFGDTTDVGAYEFQPIMDRIFTDGLGDATSLGK